MRTEPTRYTVRLSITTEKLAYSHYNFEALKGISDGNSLYNSRYYLSYK